MALTLCFKSSGDKGECICLREGVQKNLLSLDEKFIENFEKKNVNFPNFDFRYEKCKNGVFWPNERKWALLAL